MNRKIGEVFDFCGVKLKVVKRGTFDCDSCFFVKRGLPCGAYPLPQYFGHCGRYAREDDDWIEYACLFGLRRWAYMKDLLPKGGAL